VIAYGVTQRRREFGVRMALGAQRADVMRMIAVQGLRPIVAGVVVGLGASYALRRVMEHQIHGITVDDPWTFAAVVAVLMAVGVAACLIPAARATRIDPLVALRSE
jgi:ABC-type antimicrobial peptide transport system permease subunit